MPRGEASKIAKGLDRARLVVLDAATGTVLREHRRATGRVGGPVFTTGGGGRLDPSNVRTRGHAVAIDRAGLPPIRLHDLRHTWATLALQAGVHPKVVSERLGHATTSITLDIYSHVQPELDAEAATTVARLFDPTPDPLTIIGAADPAQVVR